MSMTKTHFEDKQSQFSRLVDQIVVAIRSDDFKRWCLKVHNTVKYDELADNLSKYNQDMMGNKMNIVEWYLQCQQLNADIVANLLSSVAAHLTEEMTRVPIIKQLVYLIDQVVIAGLNCTHYVFQHTSLSKDQIVAREDPSWLHNWYSDNIKPSLNEIKDAFHSISQKHATKDELAPDHKRLSTLSAAILVTASLIKLQAHIVTGLLTVPAKGSGDLVNAVIEKLNPHAVLLFLGNTIKDLLKFIVKIPFEAEAILLERWQKFDQVLMKGISDFENTIESEPDHAKRLGY